MLVILSPAKTLDETPVQLPVASSTAHFAAEAWQLVSLLRQLDQDSLAALLKISPALAERNRQRMQNFSPTPSASVGKYAALLYHGDTYEGLQAARWQTEDWLYAQHSLVIVSGLYGLLRPLDRIQPYRLEMSTRLLNARGKDLYAFWGESLRQVLTQWAAGRLLVNLASEEYSKALSGLPMLTPVFQEQRAQKRQVVGLLAKRARGRMASWIMRQRLQEPLTLQEYQEEGYCYRADLSNSERWYFVRDG
ncbi:YaaA family protein [Candidatus Magnetaquicoccus inordinatus]|uniref:YaaA family protein n=1 Tax=Candidatus Magnetaquicoccus inordinatus TaxID=2496818 RepID=UPI00102C8AE3|nr:peroxide stress protein YaaA [Candidatus Magnetaquicoccus inordinatus]